jgi:elongation factor G
VQLVLDAIVDYLPSPLDVPAGSRSQAAEGRTRPSSVAPDDSAPFSALAFKIMSDPYVGRLTYLRVYSGVLKSGSHVQNSTKDRKERIGRILQMHANHREDKEAGLHRRHRRGGGAQALHDRRHDLRSQRPGRAGADQLPDAGDRGRGRARRPRPTRTSSGQGLAKLADEDPTFVVRFDEETGQTVISGMGELHLDIIVDRLRREFSVDANVGKPQVAYRETITKLVHKVDLKFARQTGGPRSVRPRRARPRADGPRRRLRVHQQDLWRRDPARVHPVGRPGHPGGDGQRGAGGLPAWSTSAPR